jgi:translation initiation factor 4E (EIF-4E)
LILEDKWLSVLLSTIGESLDPSGNSICGISYVMKGKTARMEVWVKNVEDTSVIATIGRRLRSLNIAEKKEKLEFRKHGGDV